MVKKQKLRNVNFFVSDTRLVCHNLPKNITDKDLHALLKKAAGKGAVVKEVFSFLLLISILVYIYSLQSLTCIRFW